MHLLTFLEDAEYQETTFVWRNKHHTSRFAPVASVNFLKADHLIVFLTHQAFKRVYSDFANELPSGLSIQTVEIPPGATQEEHWRIAQLVNRSVDSGTEISFDISHGPLCFPLVGLLTATFMRAARNLELQHILYAAYGLDTGLEVENLANLPPNKTPIFDLNEMLTWLEWFIATERFNNTGDARNLSTLLQAERKRLTRSFRDDAARLSEMGSLGKLRGVITGLSRSLQMIRPNQSLQYIADLPERIENVEGLFTSESNSLIYSLLVDRLESNFDPLTGSLLSNAGNAASRVENERWLVNWYAERELWVEAITLAREWVINWCMYQLGLDKFTDLPNRRRIESVLGAEAHDFLESRKKKLAFHSLFMREIPKLDDLLGLWLELTDVRNDINHAGMRENPGKPEELQARIQSCVKLINSLPVNLSM
jgi:hypothetical protein